MTSVTLNPSETSVTVLIITYNSEEFIADCVQSVIEQKSDFFQIQIVIVDNNSNDRTQGILSECFSNFDLEFSPINSGFSTAVQKGLVRASNKNIFLINPDTVLNPHSLRDLIIEKWKSGVQVLGAREKVIDVREIEKQIQLIDVLGFPIFIDASTIKKESFYLTAVCLLFEKDTYSDSGGLDTNFFMYYEDTDWFWRLRLFDIKFKYSENVYINHYGQGSTKGDVHFSYDRFLWRNTNQLRMLLKNYQLISLFLVLPVFTIVTMAEILILVLIGRISLLKTYFFAINTCFRQRSDIRGWRKFIKERRVLNDFSILRSMYLGFSNVKGLRSRISSVMRSY